MDDRKTPPPAPQVQPAPSTEIGRVGPTTEQLAQWRQQHGELLELSADDDEHVGGCVFIFREPGKTQLSRFIQKAMKNAYGAMRQFTFDLLLYPSREEVTRLFDEKPGLLVAIGGALQRETGTGADFSVRRR